MATYTKAIDMRREDNFVRHLNEREAQNCYSSTRLWTPRPHLLGMIGEEALASFFGAQQDFRNRPYGDGNVDLEIKLTVSPYRSEWFKVDAKCSSYGDVLRVDREIIKPRTIYVLVHAIEGVGKCIGWEWGRVLMQIPVINWCNNGVFVHAKRVPLRDMEELRGRFCAWRHGEGSE